jgi:hypothetical protein
MPRFVADAHVAAMSHRAAEILRRQRLAVLPSGQVAPMPGQAQRAAQALKSVPGLPGQPPGVPSPPRTPVRQSVVERSARPRFTPPWFTARYGRFPFQPR